MSEVDRDRGTAFRSSLPWLTAFALLAVVAGCSSTSSQANGNDAGQAGGDDATTGDDGSTDDEASTTDGGTTDATTDGSTSSTDGSSPDASPSDASPSDAPSDASFDAEAGGGCVKALFGSYVVRTDGRLLEEGSSGSETAVLDANTGLPIANVQSVQDGTSHGCAALSAADGGASGGAWCWRTAATGNSAGQLGNGGTDTSGAVFHATQVLTAVNQPLANVASVADGPANTACAVTEDGKLYCWGDLTWTVNNGTALASGYAVPITTDGTTPLTGVIQAVVHPFYACALVTGTPANSIWCWGYNQAGRNLGTGDSNNHQYPTKVVGATNPTKIVLALFNGSYGNTCVLDGTNVRCWGPNSLGAAGNNNTATDPVLTPTLVLPQTGTAPLDGVVDLKPGDDDFCALRTDSTIWCWGRASAGPSEPYASNYGVTNVVLVGSGDPRFLTSDGLYHVGSTSRTTQCGPL